VTIFRWALSQLVSYGVAPHLLVAVAVVLLDVQWIQSEMREPGWSGEPDQDIVFAIGVLLRVVLVNAVLLPVGLIALRFRQGRARRREVVRQAPHKGAAKRGAIRPKNGTSGPRMERRTFSVPEARSSDL
jgi:hypothetical protein